ncbi:hypothetical protein MMC22_004395 [Lobaria immixta]|nr:hypothetical protein [Lobaria immixta]
MRENMTAISTAKAASTHGPLIPSTSLDLVSAVLCQSQDANNSRPSTPPASLATVETSSTREDAVGTDSGYGSKTSTPNGPESFISQFELSKGNLLQRKVTKLKHFDKQISQRVQDRFHDLDELFSKPLYEYLSKARVGFSAISIKLKVLGESEETAKPWIVVLCDKAAHKKVKQFFDQKQVKSQYQPCCPELSLPYFDIIYYSRPPKQTAATDSIYGEAWGDATTWQTLCGKSIRIGEPDATRIATLGGIVKVVTSGDHFLLYGMTVGHIVARDTPKEDDWEKSDDKESDGEASDSGESESGEETFELFLTPEEDQVEHEAHSTRSLSDVGQIAPLWSKIGHVSDASGDCHTNKNLDWALVKIDDPSFYRPNLIVASVAGKSDRMKEQLREPSRKAIATGPDRDVFVMSGTCGFKQGKLSSSSSFLMVAPGNSFAKTHDLALSDGSELKSGDSGSWVVGASTYEVYGHVVATDAFGEAYVIPLRDTLRQMKTQLDVESVSLPTEDEVCDWLLKYRGTSPIVPWSTASPGVMLSTPWDEANEAQKETEVDHTCRALEVKDPTCAKSTNANQSAPATKQKPKKGLTGFTLSSRLRRLGSPLKAVWAQLRGQKNRKELPEKHPAWSELFERPFEGPVPELSSGCAEDSHSSPLSKDQLDDQLVIRHSSLPISDDYAIGLHHSGLQSMCDTDDCSQSLRNFHDSGYSSATTTPIPILRPAELSIGKGEYAGA